MLLSIIATIAAIPAGIIATIAAIPAGIIAALAIISIILRL